MKTTYYLFRCSWNGTNEDKLHIVRMTEPHKDSDIDDLLDSWVGDISSHVSERIISYSWEVLKIPTLKKWQTSWLRICKKKRETDDEYNLLHKMQLYLKHD